MSRRTVLSDDFNRADGPISDGNADWLSLNDGNIPLIDGNEVANEYTDSRVYYSHAWNGPDQWVQMRLSKAQQLIPERNLAIFGRNNGARQWALMVYYDMAYIHELPDDRYRASVPYTPQDGDVFRLELEGSEIRAYINDTLVMTATDNDLSDPNAGDPRPLGGNVGFSMFMTTPPYDMRADDFSAGDFATGFQLGQLNTDNSFESNGEFTVTGSLLNTVTSIKLTDGVDEYPLTILSQADQSISCSPVDVLTTKYPYGPLTLEATDGELVSTIDVTFKIEPGYEVVTLTGIDHTLLAENLSASEGDLLEVEDLLGGSNLILFANSNAHYDPAVPDGTTHTRKLYDADLKTWDVGTVTINQPGGSTPGNPPVWKATPAPPDARVGEPYFYKFGNLLDGDRPMTFTDKGTILPAGMAYDATPNEEGIRGVAERDELMTGIITEAENAV